MKTNDKKPVRPVEELGLTDDLIKSAERELAGLLRDATAPLRKAAPPPPEDGGEEESSPPAAEGSAEMPEEGAAEGEAPGEGGGEDAGGGEADQILQYLSGQSPDVVMQVYQGIREMLGAQGGGEGQEASPPPPGGGSPGDMGKSEAQEILAQLRKTQERLGQVEQALAKRQPAQRAAVTGANAQERLGPQAPLNKAEPLYLSKTEITRRLGDKAREPSLSKKDRDAITNYYDGAPIGTVAHLLQEER